MARLGAHSLLLRAQIPAGARVDDLAVGAVGGVRRVELTPSAEAGIEQPLLFQLFQRHAVDLAALALIKFRAAGASALVPVQTQPAEVLFHPVAERALAAVWIQILQPQYHHAAAAAHGKPCQQGGPCVAQMHPSAGGGGEASA